MSFAALSLLFPAESGALVPSFAALLLLPWLSELPVQPVSAESAMVMARDSTSVRLPTFIFIPPFDRAI
ncbi:hypothetical protein D3C80_1843570 [compost metagenome]